MANTRPDGDISRPPDEAINSESDATYNYFAFAKPGTSTATAAWKVFRVTIAAPTVKQYADGNDNYDNVGSGLSALTYS